MENLKSLTSGEEQVMKIIWKLGPTYLKDIMLAFPEPKPHQNTVSTFLKNLVTKNYLKPVSEGRIHKYEISVTHENYKKTLLKKNRRGFRRFFVRGLGAFSCAQLSLPSVTLENQK